MRLIKNNSNKFYRENKFLSVGYIEGIGRFYYRSYEGTYLKKETYSNNISNIIFKINNRYYL